MKHLDNAIPFSIPPRLFTRNRARLTALFGEDDVLIHSSSARMPRNGDQYYPYRQHSGFFYLTGVEQAGSILVAGRGREVLLLRRPDPKTVLWDGPLLERQEASRISGIRDVRWMEEKDMVLEELLQGARRLYMNFTGGYEEGKFPDRDLYRELGLRWPTPERMPVEPLMTRLRMIKQEEEVELLRNVARISGEAFLKVLGLVKPGVKEYEIMAELGAEFMRRGASGHAFEPIVASGPNSLVLHYVQNRGTCHGGDLLLMDFGAEMHNYAADCSRTIPVSGTYTSRQKEVYEAARRVFLAARSLMVPGRIMKEFHEEVGQLWEREHLALGLYSMADVRSADSNTPLWKRYYPHGTSHSLGLDVHDPFDRDTAFAPGMVLTCEPGIYIPEEGIGIRLENDILVTKDGPVDLMGDLPMEAGEIEELMQA